MNEQTKISDLTVAEFRTLMQQCFDADRRAVQDRKNAEWAAHSRYMLTGQWTAPIQQESTGGMYEAAMSAAVTLFV